MEKILSIVNFAFKKKYKYALMLHGDNQYKLST